MSITNIFPFLLALVLFTSSHVLAAERCIYCRGINCQRSNYSGYEECSDRLDACVSVFQGGVIQAQGCLGSLEDNWREKCGEDGKETGVDCEICILNKCNNLGSKRADCLQCNSTQDSQCSEGPELLVAQTCSIARTGRSFCYSSIVGNIVERGCSLTLSDQVKCLADSNCHLCDPLEQPHCNDQIIKEDDSSTTDSTTDSTTSSSGSTQSSSSTSTSTSSFTSSSTSSPTTSTTVSPTTSTTVSPTTSTTTEIPPTTKPNSAFRLQVSILLIFAQLALGVYNLHK